MSKVCPSCQSEYEDDVEVCAQDGETLVSSPDASELDSLGANPELLDVIQVSPGDATSVVDLEAIEDQLRERAQKKALENEQIERDRLRQQDEAEALALRRQDPEATGTLRMEDMKRKRKAQEEERRREELSKQEEEEEAARREATADDASGEGRERTSITQVSALLRSTIEKTKNVFLPSNAGPATANAEKKKKEKDRFSPALAAVILFLSLFGAGAIVLGTVFFKGPGKGPMLTVTSIPPGAVVLLDDSEAGTAPLQTRVKTGAHIIQLSLHGYHDFKEVVEVSKTGLQFLQPLKRDPKVSLASSDAGAFPAVLDAGPTEAKAQLKYDSDILCDAITTLIKEKRFDDAMASIRALVRLAPDDLRSDRLIEDLANARVADGEGKQGSPHNRRGGNGRAARRNQPSGSAVSSATSSTLSTAQKRNAARVAYEEGMRLYRAGQFKDAKLVLQRAIQLDSRFDAPHRALGRIYNRENNERKTRYHLQRFLALGGNDPDFKVRDWVKAHPSRHETR